jgi:ribosomal protein L37AE/L43A
MWKQIITHGCLKYTSWSLWPNIRFLPSIVAEKNVTKNVHICSMCIETNQVGKQEVGIWRVQKCYPQYGIPIWSLWPNIRFLSSIAAEKNEHICSMCIKINKIGKQEVGIWWVQKRFPWYGVPIWSLWPNIRFLPSIVAEKNATKNEHICSMCIKINKVGKQEVGIWRVQKRYPQYGIPIWCLWPNIRFLSSTVTEKNATKNILDGRKHGQR